ncbi:hypothetical protein CLOM_g8204 [Closterium sp. NIES-68]|nr:hypothetical protein CLOM_g8204 [Closterium sp. NIES-68]GJP66110.1 hypothetical protein CLOP_g23027 [Closterium sp. NIES-67]
MDHDMSSMGHDMSSMGGGGGSASAGVDTSSPNYDPDAPTNSTSSATGGSGSMSMMMMQMWFYWGPKVTILFENWTTSGWGFYLLACFLVVVFCVLHEFLTSFRLKLSATRRCRVKDAEQGASDGAGKKAHQWRSLLDRLAVTAIYALNLTFSYAIMLIVMSFNIGLFIAVVLGLTIGFFFFGAKRRKNSSERPENEEVLEENCCGGGTSDACCTAP